MKFDPYKDVDSKKIAQLQFPWELCTYVYETANKGLSFGHIYKVDQTVYNKVRSILMGNDDHNLKAEDKVYVLPGHSLAHTRLKEYFKNNNANTTKDIEKATIIAGSNNFYSNNEYLDQAKYANLMFSQEVTYELEGEDKDCEEILSKMFIDPTIQNNAKIDFKLTNKLIISPLGYATIRMNYMNFTYKPRGFFLTPTCMEIVYHILSGKLRVLTDENVSKNANSGMKLEDPETYNIINNMLRSSDSKDRSMGVELLIHCDLSGNIDYHLWKLAKEHYYTIAGFDRSKALSFFLETTQLFTNYTTDNEGYILRAAKEGILTKEIMSDLIGDIYQKNVEDCEYFNEEFFEISEDKESFEWTVKLKPKWLNILKPKEDESK